MEDKENKISFELDSAPFVITMTESLQRKSSEASPRVGDLCPKCHSGELDYDGMLNLACPVCGYALGGCFT